MSEIVYVLINEAMPGYLKIGRTTNLEQRMRTLDNSSVPLPFECYYAARVGDSVFVEKQLHEAFADNRVRKNREFFEISPDRIVAALKMVVLDEVTLGGDVVESDDDQRALDQARDRRSAFNFKMVDIPVGAQLHFVRDPEIICTVVDARRVEFEGALTSLSSAAATLLNRYGWNNCRSVQGPLYWQYEEENLVERRLRMEFAD